MDIYILDGEKKLKSSGKSFVVTTPNGENKVGASLVSSITMSSGSITIGAINLAVEKEIPLVITDSLGRVTGRFWENKFSSTSLLRKKQALFSDRPELIEIAKSWVIKKLIFQKEHLITLSESRSDLDILNEISRLDYLVEKLEELKSSKESINRIMGYEGVGARNYFRVIASLVPERWDFKKRELQNASDPYNMILNYLYGILYSKCESALVRAGLDPHLGILHGDNYNRKSLLFDFIEQFRHLALSTTFSMFSRKSVTNNYFLEENGVTVFSSLGKKEIIEKFQKKLSSRENYSGKNFTYEEIINIEARNFAAVVKEL